MQSGNYVELVLETQVKSITSYPRIMLLLCQPPTQIMTQVDNMSELGDVRIESL